MARYLDMGMTGSIGTMAESWTLQAAAHVVGGRLINADAEVEFVGASLDSRRIAKGELFIAFPGEHVDGHDYVAKALDNGAAAALVSRELPLEFPQIVVTDVSVALTQLAIAWRAGFEGPVLGVTGSNGKTSTKEILASIMRAWLGDESVLATRGNLNNELGVPLTLLSLRSSHRAAIIEMGASAEGEIEHLAGMARPNISLITNAGPAHLEGFGDLDGVARGKGEIYAALPVGGSAIINRDDPYFDSWCQGAEGRQILSFGLVETADVGIVPGSLESDAAEGYRWRLRTPFGDQDVAMNLPGQHQINNALAATAAALASGCPLTAIAAGLRAIKPVAGRMQSIKLANGAQLVDDSYNANPGSVRAALAWLAKQSGQRYLVLGAMAELGSNAAALHRDIGVEAAASGIEGLIAVGAAAPAAEGFGVGGQTVTDTKAAVAVLNAELTADALVLVKGSRSAGLERIVTALQTSVTNNQGEC